MISRFLLQSQVIGAAAKKQQWALALRILSDMPEARTSASDSFFVGISG